MMLRASPFPMISVAEAREIILSRTPRLSAEQVPLSLVAGRVLAEDVLAPESLPALPRSSVDGYAVVSADGVERRTVLEEVSAGRVAQHAVVPGTSVRIMTGAPVPPGADAVVMVEDTEEQDGVVEVHARPRAGENVHPVGTDLRQGERVLAAGTTLGAAEVGLLATIGLVSVPVIRLPRVAVLATGDELVDPDQVPPPGSIRDSNRFALIAAVQEAGGSVVWQGRTHDDEAALEASMRAALAQADVLVTSGGVSMGTRDLIKPLMDKLGSVHFGRISFKPGKPLTFATTADGKQLFGLPGFPVSSLVTFEVFVRPALRMLGGRQRVTRPEVDVALEHDVRPDGVRLEYQRAAVTWQDGRWLARTTGLQVSSRLMSVVGANALLQIEPGDTTLPAGSTVKAWLLADL